MNNNPVEPDDAREPFPTPTEPSAADEPFVRANETVPLSATSDPETTYSEATYPATTYPATASPSAPRPKARTRMFYIVAGVIGTVLVVGLLCGATLGFGAFHAWQTSTAVSPVLEETMQAMEAKDVDKAETLFGAPIRGEELRANLQQMIDTPEYYAYFDGYERLSIQEVNAGVSTGDATDNPPGEYARVTADVTYQDATHRTLTALLNKIDGQWRLLDVQISDPVTPGATPASTPAETPAEGA